MADNFDPEAALLSKIYALILGWPDEETDSQPVDDKPADGSAGGEDGAQAGAGDGDIISRPKGGLIERN